MREVVGVVQAVRVCVFDLCNELKSKCLQGKVDGCKECDFTFLSLSYG